VDSSISLAVDKPVFWLCMFGFTAIRAQWTNRWLQEGALPRMKPS